MSTRICENINTCSFMVNVIKLMPITAITIKVMYCNKFIYGRAKYQEHEIIAIDRERGNLCSGYVMDELELFEKQFSESYKKLCVRRHRAFLDEYCG